MLQIFKKIVLYVFTMLLVFEILVRVFHLHNERPQRFLDDKNVEKWVPNQNNFSITGNRKQNVGEYRINNFGFNSVYDTYEPSKDQYEIALVGDSFIEGFHEDYTNSLGQQIERELEDTAVIEFGYAGYDLADELHLIHSYAHLFSNIDHTFIYLRYADDLGRSTYEISSRLNLDSKLSRTVKQIKLLVYLRDIGALDPLTQLPSRIKGFVSSIKGDASVSVEKSSQETRAEEIAQDQQKLENFKKLIATYSIDKEKFTFLLDRSTCSDSFLAYLEAKNYKILDLNIALNNSKQPTTLVYDQHWSQHGRMLLADLISNYVAQNNILN
jgi:hypothetical protein